MSVICVFSTCLTTGDSKLTFGVNVSVNGGLSLYVALLLCVGSCSYIFVRTILSIDPTEWGHFDYLVLSQGVKNWFYGKGGN